MKSTKNNKPVILFRTDGNAIIGYGHTMRMLALAEMVANDFNICFVLKDTSDWLAAQISKSHSILQIPQDCSIRDESIFIANDLPKNSALIILDGYNFDTAYQFSMRKELKIKIVSIDDFQPFKYVADLVINHAGLLQAEQFKKESYTNLLLGPQYALLRKEFSQVAKMDGRIITKIKTAFVCLGGSDTDLYKEILFKLLKLGFEQIIIVINDKSKLENVINGSKIVKLYSNLSAKELVSLMNQSDLAILPASTLCYEYCCVSGGLFIIQTAENQKFIYNFMVNSGCAFAYDELQKLYSAPDFLSKITDQIEKQKEYFNGRNETYLIKAIFQTAFFDKLELKKATEKDLMFHFKLSNDPDTRRNSFNKEPISIETHTNWFKKKISSSESVLFTLQAPEISLGTIRFDFDNNNSILSYAIDKKYRQKGLGFIILKKGIEKIKNEFNHICFINGYVHENNFASINSFLKVGFKINTSPPKHFDNYNYYSYQIIR